MCIHGFVSGGPASRSNTRYRPLSDNRAATTAPAEPAPDTINSNVSLPSLVVIRPPMCALDDSSASHHVPAQVRSCRNIDLNPEDLHLARMAHAAARHCSAVQDRTAPDFGSPLKKRARLPLASRLDQSGNGYGSGPSLSYEQASVFARAPDFLGLPVELVRLAHGRVPFRRFARELLKSERKVVGFYDATVTGIDPFPDRDYHQAPDPTLASIERVFASGINHVLRAEIGIDSERRYELLSLAVNRDWKRDEPTHALWAPAGATDDLRFAISMSPDLKVLIAHGHYDMVTPYFSSERLVEQMKLLPQQREQLFIRHFGGGHMFYI